MASYNQNPRPDPININRFLGLNEAVGETQIELGECVSMRNFRITKNFKAQKREGYDTLIDYSNAFPVYAWYGKLDGDEVIISSNNGKIYEYDVETETNTEIGDLTDTSFVNFFNFNGILYLQNGTDYKSYDGTTYGNVDPYVPTIVIETPPAGGGTLFEETNVLTGEKIQEFRADGVATVYQLAETNVDSIDLVTVDGVTKTGGGTDYSVSLTNGTVTFTTAPLDEALVIISWTKAATASPNDVKKCKHSMAFGAGNDTNIFMWGNSDKPNTRFRSYIEDPSYFPANNFVNIGSSEFAITDIVGQYSRQIIFKENATFYSNPEQISYADGRFEFEYPIFDLNENVGNVAFGQARLIRNNPFTLSARSIWEWVATNVEDEKNAKIISDKVKLSLLELDLKEAITYDFQRLNEYWLCVGEDVYILNYFNDTFYKFTNIPAKQFFSAKNQLYFTTNGTIERFDNLLTRDNGETISARLELGFNDFGVPHLSKNTRKIWTVIRPEARTSLKILWQTDRKASDVTNPISVDYTLITFINMDFADFGFRTNRNPETFRRKARIKKYSFVKFIFLNEEQNETLTILSMRVQAEVSGQIR